jgi:hypothetical protein
MNNIKDGFTAEAKANMLANLQIDSRKEKLRAQCDAQCASMQSRLERRVNRIPTVTRQTTLLDLLKASAPAQPVAVPAPTTKTVPSKKTSAPAPAAPAARKTRNAAPANPIPSSSAPATSSPDTRRVKPAPKTNKPTPTYAKETKTTRAKKRSSDEMSGEDKENTDLPVPKKRTRNVVQKPTPAAPTTRATRAASRTKTTTSQVLSPKTNVANVRKPAARSVRPR